MARVPVTLTLVHGTWPRGLFGGNQCPWYSEKSPTRKHLCEALQAEGIQPYIETFEWSGSNSLTGRRAAVLRLRHHVLRLSLNAPERLHFIIAHSHGGNVALRAIELVGPQRRPAGLITLGTPFMALESRYSSPAESFMAAMSAGVVFVFLYLLLMNWVFGLIASKFAWNGVPGTLLMLASSAVLGYLMQTYWGRCSSAARRTIARIRSFGNRRRISPTHLLCIRAPGDEASLVLAMGGIVEVLSKLGRSIVDIVANICKLIVHWVSRATHGHLWRIFPFVIFMYIVAFTMALLIDKAYQLMSFNGHPDEVVGLYRDCAFQVVLYFGSVIYYFAIFVVGLVFCAFIVGILFLILSGVARVGYGVEYMFLAWRYEIDAEAAPQGLRAEIYHVTRAHAGMHHAVYNSPEARGEVVRWIASAVDRLNRS